MIVVRTRWTERDLGLTVFGLNQGRVALRFCDLLSEALKDRGLEVGHMPPKRIGARFVIDVDMPVMPKGSTVSSATGGLYSDPAYFLIKDNLESAFNRWGIQTVDNWKDVAVRPLPHGLDCDLRIAPFFADCVGAQILALRLENLANRLADPLLPILSQWRVPIATVPPSRKDWPS